MRTMHAETRPSSRSELATWYEAALEEQEHSELSVAEYATEIGVTAATLYSWRRRLETAPPGRREASGLVRVQVRPDTEPRGARTDALVVRVGRRRSIEIPSGFDGDELARVIEVLETC